MDVRISARHCTIPESTREVAHTRVARMTRYEPRATAAEVLFSDENAFKHAEIRLNLPGRSQLQAHGEAETFRSALDRALERLDRQLRRRHARVRDHKAVRTADAVQAN